jgi:hypothetical protein
VWRTEMDILTVIKEMVSITEMLSVELNIVIELKSYLRFNV